ncbi:MAG: primosomal protein N', partial [Clostridia bacterium]|nr:primosomal protein N' [Clostridia bacterium]
MFGKIAEVALEGASFAFDKRYSYVLPEQEVCSPGCRVVVPFGKADLKRQGIVLAVRYGETDGLKSILTVIDKNPVLSEELLGMCEYMKEHTFCTYYDAVRAMLPAGISYRMTDYYVKNSEFTSSSLLSGEERELFDFIGLSEEVSSDKIKKTFENSEELLAGLVEKEAVFKNCSPVRKMGDATQKWVRLSSDTDEENPVKLTARQSEIIKVISDVGSVSIKELKYFTGVTDSVINTLINKGLIKAYEKEVFRTPYRNLKSQSESEITLTNEQDAAFRGMMEKINSKTGSVALLYGVTGSGKTQVFLKLADAVSSSGKGVILMVPEIALTPQMINIFSARYGSKIAVFHSAMSAGQRMDEWKRIKNGEALIAIGTRSAVFSPFENLGLIIMDEEQEHTYKSEKNPKFHARDLAKYRVSKNGALLCLASATPSVESYSAALAGKYSLFTLKERYGNAVLPQVSTVDMRKEVLKGNNSCISKELCDEIELALKNKNQAIVLLNRRGHNTYISCPQCGYVFLFTKNNII